MTTDAHTLHIYGLSVWMLYKTNTGHYLLQCTENKKTASHILQWRHNEHDSVSNHQPHDCLLKRLFGRRSKKTSKRRVTGLCAGNSPGTGEFPAQRVSNAENVSIWWRHHVNLLPCNIGYYRCEKANPPMTNQCLVDCLTSLEHVEIESNV